MKPHIAVIMFPGTNCEGETARACEAVGMDATIIRWNENVKIQNFDGYILPGGFSYEDRVRAGVISAQDPIMKGIKIQANKGKVVLGICNGAQILVETGFIPGIEDKVQMALAPNVNPFVSGYYCSWVNVKVNRYKRTAFNQKLKHNQVVPMPVAHGEGRFITSDKKVLQKLIDNDQMVIRYCDKDGNDSDIFPDNPNGASVGIAGLCNEKGNVMALMPHPEKATWNRQVPYFEGNDFAKNEGLADGSRIFASMKQFIERQK